MVAALDSDQYRLRTPRWAPAALAGTAVLLGSGLLTQLLATTAARVAVGVGCTVALACLAGLAARRDTLVAARDGLLALTALSVFGWASAVVVSLPPVEQWLSTAPVASAFLVVNATKLSSVLVLLVIMRRAVWTRWRLYLRVGSPQARSFVPGVPWWVLGPLVIAAVTVLFVTTAPGVRFDGLNRIAPWLPVMLAGAVVNAACEELLYRHALINTTRRVLGVRGAVLVSSAVFGLAHLTGTPGGLAGVAYTFGYGAVCAMAMLQARGAFWNVVIHVGGDLAAVATLFLAS